MHILFQIKKYFENIINFKSTYFNRLSTYNYILYYNK